MKAMTHFSEDILINKNRSAVTDQPIIDAGADLLGSHRYATGLGNFIAHAKTPITIGIQGGWGSGKTSLINMLMAMLDEQASNEKPGIVSVAINAWEHSLFQDGNRAAVAFSLLTGIVNALLNSIEKAGLVSAESQQTNDVKVSIKKLGILATRALAFSADLATGSGLSGALAFASQPLPGEMEENPAGSHEGSVATEIANLRSSITELVEATIRRPENNVERFAIFVDDLDRVHPQTAVEILDVMKNILNIPRCVFVLAIDYDVVVKGLSAKFGQRTEDNEREFRQYFDKIIQVPFTMPIGSYGKYFPDFVAESIGQFSDVTLSRATKSRLGDITSLVTDGSPRSVKRIVNTLSLLHQINLSSTDAQLTSSEQSDTDLNDNESAEIVVKFIVVGMQISYPEILQALAEAPDFLSWQPEGVYAEDLDEPPWATRLYEICESRAWTKRNFPSILRVMEILVEALNECEPAAREYGTTPRLELLKDLLDASSLTSVSESDSTESIIEDPKAGYRHDDVTTLCRHTIETLSANEHKLFSIVNYVATDSYAKRAGTGRGDREFSWLMHGNRLAAGSLHFDRHRDRVTYDVSACVITRAEHGSVTQLRRYLRSNPPPGTTYESRDQIWMPIGTVSIKDDISVSASRLATEYLRMTELVIGHVNSALG